MGSVYFVTQEATSEILLRVTNMCSECYNDISLGDKIHYDMQNYRYLCEKCQASLSEKLNAENAGLEEQETLLF